MKIFDNLYDAYGQPDRLEFEKALRAACGEPCGGYKEDKLYAHLVEIISLLTGVKTVRAYEQGVRPKGQYITVFISSAVQDNSGYMIESFMADDIGRICERYVTAYNINILLNCYCESGDPNRGQYQPTDQTPQNLSAFDALVKLNQRLNHQDVIRSLVYSGIRFYGYQPINNAPATINATYEQRAFTTLSLKYCVSDTMQQVGRAGINLEITNCFDEELKE